MALISAKKASETEKRRIEINQDIYSEIQSYCAWAEINDLNHFFEEAATFVFSKDKDWKTFKKSSQITKKMNKETA